MFTTWVADPTGSRYSGHIQICLFHRALIRIYYHRQVGPRFLFRKSVPDPDDLPPDPQPCLQLPDPTLLLRPTYWAGASAIFLKTQSPNWSD